MLLVIPTEGASSDVWDTLLNAACYLVDSHDHTSGNGVPVPTAGLDIDDDLPFAGNAITGLLALDLQPTTTGSVSTYTTALFVASDDDELYWRTAAGVNVQLTAGTSLNATLLGGFTGDYGSGDEEAHFATSTAIYNFLRDTTHRANVDMADLRLFEGTAGITNAVKLKSPTALAASYTLTMPAALPAGPRVLVLEADGDVATAGAATLDGDLTISANNDVTVSGTGRFKHGAMQLMIPGQAFVTQTGDFVTGTPRLDVDTEIFFIPVTLPVGARVTGWSLRVTDNVTGTTVVEAEDYRIDAAAGVLTGVGNSAASAGDGTIQTITDGSFTPYTIIATEAYGVSATIDASNACSLHWLMVTYDFP